MLSLFYYISAANPCGEGKLPRPLPQDQTCNDDNCKDGCTAVGSSNIQICCTGIYTIFT